MNFREALVKSWWRYFHICGGAEYWARTKIKDFNILSSQRFYPKFKFTAKPDPDDRDRNFPNVAGQSNQHNPTRSLEHSVSHFNSFLVNYELNLVKKWLESKINSR